MSLQRIWVLLRKEFALNSRTFVFLFALLTPIVMSLVVSVVFGNLFAGKPRLGIVDQGAPQTVDALTAADYITTSKWDSQDQLISAVRSGAVDAGLVLPAQFEDSIKIGQAVQLPIYVWGESLLRNRAILGATISDSIVKVSDRSLRVNLDAVVLGDGAEVSWTQRLLPFLVLMAVIIAGSFIPATSLITEKQKRTLSAVVTTPANLAEVFIAKGILGALLSVFVALAILFLNTALGTQPALLILVLFLGAVLAAAFGVLLGALIKDTNTLFATLKGMGILLYAPGLISMFPTLPQWIAGLFPTYYIVNPVIDISQKNASLTDILPQLAVLVVLIAIVVGVLGMIAGRLQQQDI